MFPTAASTAATTGPATAATVDEQTPLAAESLIEEVSIDGMCGVY